jgi:hypothetical protein
MTKLFTVAWFISGAIILIVYLLRPENRFVLGGAALLVMMLVIPFIREALRRKREGFYVNTRGNADGGDVIYHEDEKSLTFYFDRLSHIVYVPSNRKWEEEMPEWAKRRKIEIVERITKRMGKHWKFIEKNE